MYCRTLCSQEQSKLIFNLSHTLLDVKLERNIEELQRTVTLSRKSICLIGTEEDLTLECDVNEKFLLKNEHCDWPHLGNHPQ